MIERCDWRGARAYQFRLRRGGLEDVVLARFHDFPEETIAAKGGYLSIWHHNLSSDYGRMLSHHRQPGNRLFVEYGYRDVMWSVHLGVDLGKSKYSTSGYLIAKPCIGADLTYGQRRVIGPLGLEVGWGIRTTEQPLNRQDKDLLGETEYGSTRQLIALSNNPTITLGYPLMLSPGWYLSKELVRYGCIRRKGEDQRFRREPRLKVGLGVN